jgi:hypothetical protein
VREWFRATWELGGWMRWLAFAAFLATALLIVGFVVAVIYGWTRLVMST